MASVLVDEEKHIVLVKFDIEELTVITKYADAADIPNRDAISLLLTVGLNYLGDIKEA